MYSFGRMPPFWLSLCNSVCGLVQVTCVYVASLLDPMPFDAVAMKAMASFIREKITQEQRGPNQAHNLTNIFHTTAFSNMLLQGSSATVLQCSLLPSYTGAVFNSSGARLRELCQQGGTKLSQGDFLLVWRVMLAHYPWKLVIYLCCIIRVIVFYTLYYIIITPFPPIYRATSFTWKPGQGFRPRVTPTILVLIQSCRSLNKRRPVTGTSSARNVHLEQIWAVKPLLLGLHAQKKQCFVLGSWIITVTAEHRKTFANTKMRPKD